MKRLFGILENNPINNGPIPTGEKRFLLFDGKDFTIEANNKSDLQAGQASSYPIYDIIKSRNSIIGKSEYFGEGVFVFRYGPVTSWVIEPGVFYIYTYGERILGINIDVSYKARNIEQKLIGLSPLQAIPLAESVCGNFTFSHSLAFTNSIEKILGVELNPIIKSYKIIALELERIYNHLYVFSQLANAAAQKVLTSHVQFLFEESLRTNFLFSRQPDGKAGSRYLKGINSVGKLNSYPDKNTLNIVNDRVNNINKELTSLYARTLESKNFLDRLHDTSKISGDYALNNSLSGPSLRACGIKEDLRNSDKFYEDLNIPTIAFGDSLARLEVRIEEIFVSIKIINDRIDFIDKVKNLIPFEESNCSLENITGNAIGAVESPSGIIAYYTELENGKIKYIYTSTPSLFGLNAIKDSLPGMIFTDFPFSVDSFGSFFADAAR
ncbi:MAG: NADH-quinone oxidoreductase subunit D-related protein [Ignavibacteriaceae bacterium]